LQFNPLALGCHSDGIDRTLTNFGKIGGLRLNVELAGDDARGVEQVIDRIPA
jgi:hypothetical protein